MTSTPTHQHIPYRNTRRTGFAFPANEIRNEQQENNGCGENEISFHHGVLA